MLSRTSQKYYSSEIMASLLAMLLSVLAALAVDRVSDSEVLISVVSALGGTLGFLVGVAGVYGLLHIRAYRQGQRNFAFDMKTMTLATLQGVLVMYAVRIPGQYLLLKLHVTTAAAALVAQGVSGLMGTFVRGRHNYRANIFGVRRVAAEKVE